MKFNRGDILRFTQDIRKIYPKEVDRIFEFIDWYPQSHYSTGGLHHKQGKGVIVKIISYPDKPENEGRQVNCYVDSMFELIQDPDNEI